MPERWRPTATEVFDKYSFLRQVSPEWEKKARIAIDIFLKLAARGLEVEGEENIPQSSWQTYIVSHNHLGWVEVPVLLKVFPRWIYWMSKAENFGHKLLGPILQRCAFFPVKRGMVDRQALRTASGLLDIGEVVGMAPEGTRGRKEEFGQLKRAKNGTILLAMKAGVPIIPVAVWGPEKLLPLIEERGVKLQDFVNLMSNRPQIFVRIGRPFTQHLQEEFKGVVRKEQLTLLTTNLMVEIRDMLPVQYHGFYAHMEKLPLLTDKNTQADE